MIDNNSVYFGCLDSIFYALDLATGNLVVSSMEGSVDCLEDSSRGDSKHFISGLLKLGMSPGAAHAFLIAGPVTTLPAMVAVWGIASRKVFFLYLSFSIFGALLSGLLFNLVN